MLGHRTLNFEDYAAMLRRRWSIILIPMIVVPIIAIAATFFIQPEYMSQSLVLIDQQKVSTNIVQSAVTEDLSNRLASMKEQIESRSSLQPVVEKYNLYASEHMNMDDRIDKTRKDIGIEAIQSNLARANGLPGFKVTFKASDPHTAQAVCDQITSMFTARNLQLRSATAEGTTDYLKTEFDQAKQALDDQDAKLAAFQTQHLGMLPSDQAGNINLVNTLNTQLEAATQQLQGLEQNESVEEAMLSQQSSPVPVATLTTSTPQADELRLRDLQVQEADLTTRYTADYPEVKTIRREIADLQKKIAQAASAPPPPVQATPPVNRPDSPSVQGLRAQLAGTRLAITEKKRLQDSYQQQINALRGRIQSSPQVDAEEKQLTRDHDTALKIYNNLFAEVQQAKMSTDLENRQEGENFSVLDPANFPDAPTFPKRIIFAGAGLAGGLVIGLMIIGLMEYKDTALRTERDVWAFTQLPTLAVIAWSGDLADDDRRTGLLGRLFSRKKSKRLLADAPG
jgi:polysaccharide chain length determinant protein (PEP-CTERM system associated)